MNQIGIGLGTAFHRNPPVSGAFVGDSNLAGWRAARDAAGTATVLCVGDSVLDGSIFTTDDSSLITQRLGSLLRAGTGRQAIADTLACRTVYRSATNDQPYWTLVGDTPAGGFGLGTITTALASADTATTTLPAGVTSFDIFYTANGTSGTMEVRVDGVLVESFATAVGSPTSALVHNVVLAEPAAAPITVQLKSSSASSVFLDALYPYYGNEEDDVRVLDGSFGGRTADVLTGVAAVVTNTDPDLVLLSIGANDWMAQDNNAATIQSDIEGLLDRLRNGKAGVPVLLLSYYEPPDAVQAGATGATYAQFKAAVAAAAASRNAALLDLRPIIGKLTGSGPYDAGDGLHTNEAGQIAMGDAIAYALLT